MKKTICVVTSSRADFGILQGFMKALESHQDFNLQILATGGHLAPSQGLTQNEIKSHGFQITKSLEIYLDSNTATGMSQAMGLAMLLGAQAFEALKPDAVLVLGDRFEIFALTSAAYSLRIPIVHLHGGETTEGALDEAFRHSITKMASLHLTSTEEYRKRVIQLGEHPSTVHTVGSLALENLKTLPLKSRSQLEDELGIRFRKKNLLLTFHPTTSIGERNIADLENLLSSLTKLPEIGLIFTKANADPLGHKFNQMIEDYAKKESMRTQVFSSLGHLNYFSMLKQVDGVVGNSSSGLIEAPSFGVPTLNIGDRQKGRIAASSVLHCQPVESEITAALEKLLSQDFQSHAKSVKNPYFKDSSTKLILEVLKQAPFISGATKTFFDVEFMQ